MMHDRANPMMRVAAGLLLALLGLLGGCGFHLKGYQQPVSPALNGLSRRNACSGLRDWPNTWPTSIDCTDYRKPP